MLSLCIVLATSSVVSQAQPREIRVAVASNFSVAVRAITERFENKTGHKVTLVFGSSGKHYAQIKNGARLDVFLSADARRPRLLEDEGLAEHDSRFTYARGRLVLWSPELDYVDMGGSVLEEGDFRFLAIANPRLAPYGMAAQTVLEHRGLWKPLNRRIVRGENIGQAFQFVKSGNAALGFVAFSQISYPGHSPEGSYWEVPDSLYSPIEQQAVLLTDNTAARAFWDFLRTPETQALIQEYGYHTP